MKQEEGFLLVRPSGQGCVIFMNDVNFLQCERPSFILRLCLSYIYINNFRIKDGLSHRKKLTSFITVLTKVHIVKAMVFPVVMYRCESWTIRKPELGGTDAFKLWCWRRLLRVPWTARRLNQSILKEISSEYSLERLMLKLKLQYFGHLM